MVVSLGWHMHVVHPGILWITLLPWGSWGKVNREGDLRGTGINTSVSFTLIRYVHESGAALLGTRYTSLLP